MDLIDPRYNLKTGLFRVMCLKMDSALGVTLRIKREKDCRCMLGTCSMSVINRFRLQSTSYSDITVLLLHIIGSKEKMFPFQMDEADKI